MVFCYFYYGYTRFSIFRIQSNICTYITQRLSAKIIFVYTPLMSYNVIQVLFGNLTLGQPALSLMLVGTIMIMPLVGLDIILAHPNPKSRNPKTNCSKQYPITVHILVIQYMHLAYG